MTISQHALWRGAALAALLAATVVHGPTAKAASAPSVSLDDQTIQQIAETIRVTYWWLEPFMISDAIRGDYTYFPEVPDTFGPAERASLADAIDALGPLAPATASADAIAAEDAQLAQLGVETLEAEMGQPVGSAEGAFRAAAYFALRPDFVGPQVLLQASRRSVTVGPELIVPFAERQLSAQARQALEDARHGNTNGVPVRGFLDKWAKRVAAGE